MKAFFAPPDNDFTLSLKNGIRVELWKFYNAFCFLPEQQLPNEEIDLIFDKSLLGN